MYKNNITIGVYSNELLKVIKYIPYNSFEVTTKGDKAYISLKNIKWFPEYEEEQSRLLYTLSELDNGFCLVRVGDSLEDNEIYGNNKAFGLSIQRDILIK